MRALLAVLQRRSPRSGKLFPCRAILQILQTNRQRRPGAMSQGRKILLPLFRVWPLSVRFRLAFGSHQLAGTVPKCNEQYKTMKKHTHSHKGTLPHPDTPTAHADPNAYTEAVTYSEATQSNPGRQRRSGADPLTDRITEQKRPTTSVSTDEQSKKHPTHAQANICRRAEQPQWNRDDADEDEDDQLWTLVAGKKPTGKKAVFYVGNLKVGAKDNEVAEYVKRRFEKLRIRPPPIHSCKAAFTRIQISGYLDIRMSEIRISSGRLHVSDRNVFGVYTCPDIRMHYTRHTR